MDDATRHRRAKEIFLAVLDRSPAEREAFLQSACGHDPGLVEEVRELMGYQSTGGSVPAVAAGAERFPPGTVIDQRYRIVSPLGRGAMGEVYRADDLRLGETVALKFLPPGVARSSWLDRLRQEVRLARQVTHPNVCRVHDLQELEGDAFISMEYVDGENLAALLKRIGRLPQDKAIDLMWQLLQGLQAAHSQGVLHRDLKPANIMLDGSGQARITDFGIAVTLGQGESEAARAGTPAYMAPELLSGLPASRQSDLYALGLVFYEILTGHPPRLKPQRSGGELALVGSEALFEGISWLDPRVEMLVASCLEQDPDRRPPSASAALQMLGPQGSIGIDLPITLSPDRIAQLSSGEGSPDRTGLLLLALLLLSLAALGLSSTRALKEQGLALEKSPEVLAETARRVVASFGYPEEPQDRRFGFSEYLSDMGNDPGLNFWYRTSPDYLIPLDLENLLFGTRRVTYYDPPSLEVPGMISVILDPEGRLLHFHRVPELEAGEGRHEVDLAAVLLATGLEQAVRIERPPGLNPDVYADRREAWKGEISDGRHFQLDLGWLQGRPVFLELTFSDPNRPECEDCGKDQGLLEGSGQFGILLDCLIFFISLPLAIRNLHRGRVDLRGAFRLAGFVFVARELVWLLRTTHLPDLSSESLQFLVNLVLALSESVQMWLLYVAVEPYLRRAAPLTLVGWSRLLAGRLRDVRVVRDALWGLSAGALFAVLAHTDYLVAHALDPDSTFAFLDQWFFDSVMGTRRALATAGDIALMALSESLVLLFLLALLRRLLRTERLALVVFVLVTSPLYLLEGSHPRLSILLLALPLAGGMTWLLARRGLLAVIVAQAVRYCLTIFPVTLDSGSWYFELSTSLLALTVAFAAILLLLPVLQKRHEVPGGETGGGVQGFQGPSSQV